MKHLWHLRSEKSLKWENQLIRLIEVHKKVLFRLARLYTLTDQQALTVVQDAVYKAYMSKNQLKHEAHPKCWLFRKLLESGEQFLAGTEGEMVKETADSEWAYKKNEIGESILEAIRAMPDKQRMVIFLRYFEEFKVEEIACVLNLSVDSVKHITYKALTQLELELEEILTYE